MPGPAILKYVRQFCIQKKKKEKHQAGEPETERVRIYEFVNYIIHFVDVALFWNTPKTI